MSTDYRPSFFNRNAHIATIYPSLFRKIQLNYERERIITPDHDFLDLDWVISGNRRLIILLHGLEGGSSRTYMKGLGLLASQKEWDVVAINCRSCSGEINLFPRFYHHGDSNDLDTVVNHIVSNYRYDSITMVGFSMGGSIITKYLGSGEHHIPDSVIAGAAISTPFDLKGCAELLDGPGMGFYRKRFLKKLGLKIEAKSKKWPDLFDMEQFQSIRSFYEFDSIYTAPLHGFANADDFYEKSSAINYLAGVNQSFLIINSLNDPFLSDNSYPFRVAESKKSIELLTPKFGGHVGFLQRNSEFTWAEEQVISFLHPFSGID